MNRLQYTLRGIKRCEAESGDKSRERLPITPGILKRIRDVWSAAGPDPDTSMLWVACCLGFFGFLGAGEMTVPSEAGFDPSVHLLIRREDIAVDDARAPTVLRVRLKQSKTRPI